jgi:hypothetical protein
VPQKKIEDMTFTELADELDELRNAATATPTTKGRAVLLTTSKRGVFFGFTEGHVGDEIVKLRAARMCIYWSGALGGVLGLAGVGPDSSCRIGAVALGVTEIPGGDVTSITDCTHAAVTAWANADVYRG